MKFMKMFISFFLGVLILSTGCENPVDQVTPVTYLKIVTTNPAANAIGVSESSKITIKFSEAISVLTDSSIKILSGGLVVPCSVKVQGEYVSIYPITPLKKSASYAVVVPQSVVSTNGHQLEKEYSWRFVTASPDTARPTVLSTYPMADAIDFPETSPITVEFSEPILASSTLEVKILLGNSVVASSITVQSSKIIITPLVSLETLTMYTIVIPSSVTDIAGNSLGQDYQWSFTTAQDKMAWTLDQKYKMIDVDTDKNGNVYVVGRSYNSSTATDCFVARFNSNGKLAWKKDIITENHDYPPPVASGIVVDGDVVYIHITRRDIYGLGSGDLFVDAYSCISGELKWSTQVNSYMGFDILVDDNHYIYSVSSSQMTKLDQNGNILKKCSVAGALNSISITDDGIFISGAAIVGGSAASFVWKLDQDFNMVWKKQGPAISGGSCAGSILIFPKDSLVFVGESYGDPLLGIPMKSSVICYKLYADSLGLMWQKQFDGNLHIGLKKHNQDFYVFSRDRESSSVEGPIRMALNGNILWTAYPQKNGSVAVFNGKVFVAAGSNQLVIYN